ncbi:MAG TPA: hypothetical protein VFQ86_05450 [Arachidicoccus soli]|nr:hypothetical protein [Arachidicoccus soli]
MLKTRIDFALLNRQNLPIKELHQELKLAGIELLLYQNKEGQIYDVTYIDYNTKTVFNGSDLGRAYGAKGLLERINGRASSFAEQLPDKTSLTNKVEGGPSNTGAVKWNIEAVDKEMYNTPLLSHHSNFNAGKLMEIFFRREWGIGFLPVESKYCNRKKKRKKINQ